MLTRSALQARPAAVELSGVNSDETVVRSSCPTCGTVDVAADTVTVLVTTASAGGTTDPVYRYTCPSCLTVVQKPTSPKAVPLLRGAGARVVLVPAEIAERTPGTAPALDHEDLLDFVRALESADDLARLATSPPLRRPTVR